MQRLALYLCSLFLALCGAALLFLFWLTPAGWLGAGLIALSLLVLRPGRSVLSHSESSAERRSRLQPPHSSGVDGVDGVGRDAALSRLTGLPAEADNDEHGPAVADGASCSAPSSSSSSSSSSRAATSSALSPASPLDERLAPLINKHHHGVVGLLAFYQPLSDKRQQLLEQVLDSLVADGPGFWQPYPAVAGWQPVSGCEAHEYALVVTGSSAQTLATDALARTLRSRLAEKLEREDWHLGMVAWPPRRDVSSLLGEAEMAQSLARQRGRHQSWSFTPGELPALWCQRRDSWRSVLQEALQRQQFLLVIQPGVRSDNLEVHHHEMLLRLRSPDGQLVPARLFLPMARELGLQLELDRLVFRQAFRLLEFEPGERDLCCVNVSSEALKDESFQCWLVERLSQSRPLARRLVLEIPECVLSSDCPSVAGFLQAVHLTGCRLLADQVGQQAVDCGYLKKLPLDFLKIDPFIIHNIHQRREHQLYVRSLAELARRRNLGLLAMGVESAEEWRSLSELGVQAGQGRYLSESLEKVSLC